MKREGNKLNSEMFGKLARRTFRMHYQCAVCTEGFYMVLSTFISAANEKSEHSQYCILLKRRQ